MKKLKVFVFNLLGTCNRITGYDRVYVYAKDHSNATELLRKQFPCDINEYNYDIKDGDNQYSWQMLEKIYPQMYAKPNYLIINNPHQIRKKK